MLTESRRHAISFPDAETLTPARSAIGPVGPCSPGSHFGYRSVTGPGATGIVSFAWKIFRGASEASTKIEIGCGAAPGEAKAGTAEAAITAAIAADRNRSIIESPLSCGTGGGGRSGLRAGIEEASVLVEGVPVGHAGDVVADDALPPVARDPLLERFGEEPGVVEVALEESLEHPPRLVLHPLDLVMPVEPLVQVPLQRRVARGRGLGEADQPRAVRADVVERGDAGGPDAPPGGLDEIRHEVVDHPGEGDRDDLAVLRLRILRPGAGPRLAEDRHVGGEALGGQEPRPHAAVDVVVVVAHLVHEVGHLRF